MKLNLPSLILTLFVTVALPSYSQNVLWNTVQNITSDSDVSTTGQNLYAYAVVGSSAAPLLINGMTFSSFVVDGSNTTYSNANGTVRLATDNGDAFGTASAFTDLCITD